MSISGADASTIDLATGLVIESPTSSQYQRRPRRWEVHRGVPAIQRHSSLR